MRQAVARGMLALSAFVFRIMRKLPARFEPFLFAFLLSGLMSLLVSGIATWHGLGFGAAFWKLWRSAWLSSWLFAFPAVLVIAPLVRRVVSRCVDTRP